VLEWSRETDGWSPLPEDAVIKDRCLVRPMPTAALLDAALADDAIAQALLVKRPPSLESALTEAREQGREQGLEEERARSILMILSERGLPVSDDVRAAITACRDREQLDRWLRRAITAASAADVLR
jgi:hypothetical protein